MAGCPVVCASCQARVHCGEALPTELASVGAWCLVRSTLSGVACHDQHLEKCEYRNCVHGKKTHLQSEVMHVRAWCILKRKKNIVNVFIYLLYLFLVAHKQLDTCLVVHLSMSDSSQNCRTR